MKLYYRLFFVLAAATLAASCSKDEREVVFVGTMEPCDAKVALDPLSGGLQWQDGDLIWVTGLVPTPQGGIFQINRTQGRKAYFTCIDRGTNGHHDNYHSDSKFISLYPESASHCVSGHDTPHDGHTWMGYYSNVNNTDDFFYVKLPTEQHANAQGYDPRTLVMVAGANKVGDTVQFAYKNAVAFLDVVLDAQCASNVVSIKVSAARPTAYDAQSTRLAGGTKLMVFTAATDLSANYAVYGTEASHTVTLKHDDNSVLTAGSHYYVAIWPGTKSGMVIQACDADGNAVGKTLTATSALPFARNNIYQVGTVGEI